MSVHIDKNDQSVNMIRQAAARVSRRKSSPVIEREDSMCVIFGPLIGIWLALVGLLAAVSEGDRRGK
jgi:hypothetical protein